MRECTGTHGKRLFSRPRGMPSGRAATAKGPFL